jgi:hypothetical protein
LHAYIFKNIGLKSRNYYSWMREIHVVKAVRKLSTLARQLAGHLADPTTSFPSRCGTQLKKENLDV